MIIDNGFHASTKEQRRVVKVAADDTFTSQLPVSFGWFPVPMLGGWRHALETSIALKMRCVGPHTDAWFGNCPEPTGNRRAALFWLIEAPPNAEFHIQVGIDYRRMTTNEWVIFDDRILHSVTAERVWRGVAVQLIRDSNEGRK